MKVKKYIAALAALIVLALPAAAKAGWTWDDRPPTRWSINCIYVGDWWPHIQWYINGKKVYDGPGDCG